MRTILFLAGALLLTVPFAHATEACPTRDTTLTIPDTTGTLGGDLYVINDMCQFDGCLFSIWIYQESNGIPGWQPCGNDEIGTPSCSSCDGDDGSTIL